MNKLENIINKVVDMGYQYEWKESTGFHIFKNESESISIYDSEIIDETINNIITIFDL